MRIALLLVLACGAPPRATAAAETPLAIGSRERLLVVAPHPDDEVLGAGALIRRVDTAGGEVRVVLVTAGDGYVEAVVHDTGLLRPRPARYIAYGERRVGEARAALRALAVHHPRLQLLGFPDGALGRLLTAHWERRHPERSPTTGASRPPYADAVDAGRAYDGADLQRELLALLREVQPTIVALPDPLDRHPDHRATSLFTLLALRRWLHDGAPAPRLLAYLVHWPGWPPGWDALPAPEAARSPLLLPPTLPDRGLVRASLALTDAEVVAKRTALACHASQQEAMPDFLAAFVRRTEPYTVLTVSDVGRVPEMIEHPERP